MIILNVFLSLIGFFAGLIGIIYALKFDKTKQKKLIHTGDDLSSLLGILPVWMGKTIIILFSIIPIFAIILMWAQKLGMIE